MQHLDEGLLQAWLDGPRSHLSPSDRADIERHLSQCEECTRRMEALDQESGRVVNLLAESDTATAPIPDFESVVARAGEQSATGEQSGEGRPRRGWVPYAWAATVVLALGVGWAANESIQRGEAERSAGTQLSSDSTPASLAAGEPADTTAVMVAQGGPPAEPTTPDVAAGEAVSEPQAERIAEADPTTPAPSPTLREVAAVPSAGRVVAEPERRAELEPNTSPEAELEAPTEPAPGPLVVAGTITDDAGVPLEDVQVSIQRTDGTTVGALTTADGTYRLALASLQTDSSAAQLTLRAELLGFGSQSQFLDVSGGSQITADLSLSAEALALDEIVVTGTPVQDRRQVLASTIEAVGIADPSDPLPWRPMSRREAEAEVGFAILSVPELPVVSIEGADTGELRLVRVIQRLEDGGELVLVERPTDIPYAETVPPEGLTRATIQKGNLTVAATAPLSLEELEALLERLR